MARLDDRVLGQASRTQAPLGPRQQRVVARPYHGQILDAPAKGERRLLERAALDRERLDQVKASPMASAARTAALACFQAPQAPAAIQADQPIAGRHAMAKLRKKNVLRRTKRLSKGDPAGRPERPTLAASIRLRG
jgi:hypothetical protein